MPDENDKVVIGNQTLKPLKMALGISSGGIGLKRRMIMEIFFLNTYGKFIGNTAILFSAPIPAG